MTAVNPIPEGFHTITPYLVVDDVPALLDFCTRAFDAEEIERVELPDGKIAHAQVKIGDSPVMMGSAQEQWPAIPAMLHLYVEDADALYAKAVAAGAEPIREMQDEFYGDRSGGVKDSNGNVWWMASRKEIVPPEEIAKGMAEARG